MSVGIRHLKHLSLSGYWCSLWKQAVPWESVDSITVIIGTFHRRHFLTMALLCSSVPASRESERGCTTIRTLNLKQLREIQPSSVLLFTHELFPLWSCALPCLPFPNQSDPQLFLKNTNDFWSFAICPYEAYRTEEVAVGWQGPFQSAVTPILMILTQLYSSWLILAFLKWQ